MRCANPASEPNSAYPAFGMTGRSRTVCYTSRSFLRGRLRGVMDDGSENEFGANDVILLPPGLDAWRVDGERCVVVEFSRGNDYCEQMP